MLAPILIFTYNRVESFIKTIESFKAAELASESDLIVVSDGAKCVNSQNDVDKIREYCKRIDGFKSIELIFRDSNWGIVKSFKDGQSYCLNKYGRMIMLEDDNIIHPKGLIFLNQALNFYENDEKIFSISGYSIPRKFNLFEDVYFLPWYVPWVVATWKSKFLKFDWDEYYFKKNIDKSKGKTGLKKYGYFYYESAWLDYHRISNAEDARLNMYLYFNEMVTVCPKMSFVKNIGADGSGTNAGITNRFDTDLNFDFNEDLQFKNYELLNPEVLKIQKDFMDGTIFNKFLNIFYVRRLYYVIQFFLPRVKFYLQKFKKN